MNHSLALHNVVVRLKGKYRKQQIWVLNWMTHRFTHLDHLLDLLDLLDLLPLSDGVENIVLLGAALVSLRLLSSGC